MKYDLNQTNIIDPSAKIADNVIIGNYNRIGKNVIIQGFKDSEGQINIGDCNIINDNTRIIIGSGGLYVGDWNVFHNDMLIMGEKKMKIGHNCWFGQNTILDSSGGLTIGNGVRVGMYSQIWTHVASGELIEGCTLFGERETIIKDNVWLVGSCVVSSGVTVGERGVFLIGSNITKSTDPFKVYAGNPVKIMEKLSFYREIELKEKFELMKKWVSEFIKINQEYFHVINENENVIEINSYNEKEKVIIVCNAFKLKKINQDIYKSYFNLTDKTYTKNLSEVERKFYKYIYNHKARFIPISE